MTLPNTKVDIKSCAKVERIHPCDPPLPCDPYFEEDDCPTPYICQERLKNPAYPGEITTCRSGSSMPVKSCAKVETSHGPHGPHPCDSLKPCSEIKQEHHPKKSRCNEPPLCSQRIKNPEGTIKVEPCDPTK